MEQKSLDLDQKIKIVSMHIFNSTRGGQDYETPEKAYDTLLRDYDIQSISEAWMDSVYDWVKENNGKTPYIHTQREGLGHKYTFMGVDVDDDIQMEKMAHFAQKLRAGELTIKSNRDRRKKNKIQRQNRKNGRK